MSAGRTQDDFLRAARNALWEAAADQFPDAFEADDELRLTARRLLELGAEQCDAVELLREQSLHRPAHAVLRGLLESMAFLVWIGLEPRRYAELFWTGQTPGVRNVLERVGWVEEYDRTYDVLSDLTHPSEGQLHKYRHMDTGTAGGLLPEIVPDMEMYVLPGVSGPPYVSFTPMTKEEAETLYGPYLRSKGLDLALAGLLGFFGGSAARARKWWPGAAAQRLALAMRDDSTVAESTLCRPTELI